ncbi:tyrosine-protein kinase [Formosa agariphila KMM 3901]|uniref:non-specific protein-tyrosine kinase n=1 Tax=Formosa agariphila (strain DSM 15362 / KCTC 12365 / LMG 23005 / KMM 3901 / M-2Alg 35-1) TaxID=1347342 RepID=T2KQ80_FORAG|nr:tyrosine-protein kinase [Formosa agariphila]CDF80616.1 tyrosine-protein kinase [Formosa agariphila KMM 3901]
MDKEFSANNPEPNESGLNIKEEILNYLHYWKWFVLSVLIGTLIAFLYLRYTPETYSTFAKIKILDESEGLELSNQTGGLFKDSKNLDNEIQIIKSNRLLSKVVDSLDLHIRYFIEGKFTSKEIWQGPLKLVPIIPKNDVSWSTFYIEITDTGLIISKNEEFDNSFTIDGYNLNSPKKDFPFLIQSEAWLKKYIGLTYRISLQPITSAANGLSGAISITKLGTTDILQLFMVGEDTKRSEAALNKVLEQFNLDGVQDRQLVYQRTIDFVDERFLYLAEELDSIEIGKKEFQQDNNLASFSSDISYSMAKRSVTEEAVLALENQIALSKLLEAPLKDNNLSTLMPENIGIENANTNGIITQYNTVVLERENLISSAGESNPMVVALDNRLLELRKSLRSSLNAYYNQLNLSLSRLKKEENNAVGLVKSMPQKEKILRSIERQQNLKENLYLLLLQKREEAAINLAITSPSIKVVEFASSSSRPISPDSKGIYMKSILGALLVPFGILFLVFKSDNKIHDKSDISKFTRRIPIIGEIPELKVEHKLFENPHDRTILAESFRILSTNLKYVLNTKTEDKAQVVYVTSTIKGEGKTFVSVNLSLAFSSINKKVLLIGADLRNPKITVTDGPKNAKGLSDFLFQSDNKSWKDYLQKSKYNTTFLDILTAGTIPPNPTELLSNGKLEDLIEEAKHLYDYIIIDTAPIILVTDTLLISQYADATVYVTRANYTEKKLLGFSSELYETKKLNNMVYVVNGISESKTSRGYGYNYGYGYGYHQDDKTLKKYSWSWFKEGLKEKIRKF